MTSSVHRFNVSHFNVYVHKTTSRARFHQFSFGALMLYITFVHFLAYSHRSNNLKNHNSTCTQLVFICGLLCAHMHKQMHAHTFIPTYIICTQKCVISNALFVPHSQFFSTVKVQYICKSSFGRENIIIL